LYKLKKINFVISSVIVSDFVFGSMSGLSYFFFFFVLQIGRIILTFFGNFDL